MDVKVMSIDAKSKPEINRVSVDINEDGVVLHGECNVSGNDAQARMVARVLEKDMRINNHAKFPLPEPEPIKEFEEMEAPLTKEVM